MPGGALQGRGEGAVSAAHRERRHHGEGSPIRKDVFQAKRGRQHIAATKDLRRTQAETLPRRTPVSWCRRRSCSCRQQQRVSGALYHTDALMNMSGALYHTDALMSMSGALYHTDALMNMSAASER